MEIKTKFGIAKIQKDGYYSIISNNENYSKRLHRLIFEDFYKIKLPKNIIIHHNDENKTNNHIWNLVPMNNKEHGSLHNKKEKNYWYNKSLPKEVKEKMSNSKKGKIFTENEKLNLSKSKNTTGFYRVHKHICEDFTQGFEWVYKSTNQKKVKRIASVDLLKLKNKVIENNLKWELINQDNALLTIKDTNYDLEELL